MAAYTKGTISKPASLSGIDRENISNANLKKGFGEINKSYLDKGYTPTSFSPLDISKGMLPTYTKTTTTSPSGGFTTGGQVAQSFNKMIGGGGIGSQSTPSMMGLEGASMRLADAASRRNIEEKQAEAELQAKQQGYMSFAEMQRDMASKRRKSNLQEMESEREAKREKQESAMEKRKAKETAEKMRKGYINVGGRWMLPVK